jgi:hypothetical protein
MAKENPILCPFCKKPLVIQAFFEGSAKFKAMRNEEGLLMLDEDSMFDAISSDPEDEPTDYECVECNSSITKHIFSKI